MSSSVPEKPSPEPQLRQDVTLPGEEPLSALGQAAPSASPPVAAKAESSIVVSDLVRRFGDFTAVKGISFEVPRGSFFGFLGTNGAGKSTTIKMLSGVLQPTAGTATLLGRSILRDGVEIKKRIGVVPEESTLFEKLTGMEYLSFVARIYNLDFATLEHRGRELFNLLDMSTKQHTQISEYSKGMKKKLALAAALLYNPQILFLDEPFEGVDVVTTQILRRLLNELRLRGVTIFLTSHIIEIVQRLCTDFAIIHQGEIVYKGSLHKERVQEDPEGRTLEQLFLNLVTDSEAGERSLSWLDAF